jgi:hypothetical protein
MDDQPGVPIELTRARRVEIGGRLALPLLAVALLAAAIPAHAAGDPKITEPPQITGDFRVGGTMTASAKWKGGSAVWTWLRCADERLGNCEPIAGQQAPTYTAVAQDAGSRLRVRLTVRAGGKDDSKPAVAVSEPTPPIAAVEPPPAPPPAGAPTPTPAPTPAPAPPSAPGSPPRVTPPAVGGKAAPRLMSPRPIVRIRGRLTADGARVTLLTVRAPRGARIAVKCAGDHCPRRRIAIVAVIVHLQPYERILRAGTRLEIRVTRPSFIGKYSRIVMRQGRPPWRQDRCLMPGSSRPVGCPSG